MYLKSCIFSFSCQAPALNFTHVHCMYEIWVIDVHCSVVLPYTNICSLLNKYDTFYCTNMSATALLVRPILCKKIILLETLARVVILYADIDRFKHVLSIEVEI
jgi:hypothetical protein